MKKKNYSETTSGHTTHTVESDQKWPDPESGQADSGVSPDWTQSKLVKLHRARRKKTDIQTTRVMLTGEKKKAKKKVLL